MPSPTAMGASDHANARGTSLASNDSAARTPSTHNTIPNARDGRQSMRQGADPAYEGIESGIWRGVMAEEPAPKPIVLAIQQP